MLSNHFPDSEVFIPLPSYYIEENNYEMDLALIHGVVICSYGLNRHSAHATVSSTSGSNSIFNDLQEACKRRPDRPIYFFGEFTCTLSYTCLINEWSRGMQSRGTFFLEKKSTEPVRLLFACFCWLRGCLQMCNGYLLTADWLLKSGLVM